MSNAAVKDYSQYEALFHSLDVLIALIVCMLSISMLMSCNSSGARIDFVPKVSGRVTVPTERRSCDLAGRAQSHRLPRS